MSLTRLVLLRHGETDFNAEGRMQGHLDSTLTELGRSQAVAAVPALAAFAPEVVLTSDLRRASATATVFAEATGQRLRLDKRLRETNLGRWQGRTGAEVDASDPGARQRWQWNARVAPPGGESWVDVADRAQEVVAELDAEFAGTALLCAHGGLIIALTCRLLGLDEALWPRFGGIGNCHWAVLSRRPTNPGVWRLNTYNAGLPE